MTEIASLITSGTAALLAMTVLMSMTRGAA
jgi:hypothetical protein